MKIADSDSLDKTQNGETTPRPGETAGELSGLAATDAFHREQVRVLFLGLPSLMFANLAVAGIFVAMHWHAHSGSALLIWLAVLALISIVRTLMYGYLRSHGHLSGLRYALAGFAAHRWLWIYRTGVLASAVAWGVGAYHFVVPSNPLLLAFAILTIGGMCAGSVNALSVDRFSSLIFLTVTPLPVLYVLFSQRAPGAFGLSLFFIVGLLFVWLTTHRAGDSLLELITLRYESLKQAQALSAGEQRWKFALEGARQAVWDLNLHTQQEFSTERWQKMLGYLPNDTIQVGISVWRENVHPDDLPAAEAAMQQVRSGDASDYDIDYRYRHKQGHWIWVHARGSVVSRDQDGKPLRMVGTREDITETRALQAQLLQSQKMQTIGQLAGGVAHDFNNNLTAMMMSLDLLTLDNSLSPAAKETLVELGEMTDRAAAITSKLLLFARRKNVQLLPVDLQQAVSKVSTMLKRLLGETIAISVQVPETPLFAQLDPDLLDQALMNLAINARDAMPGGGELRISLSRAVFDQATLRGRSQGREGEFALLQVQDSGTGMPPEVLKHVFEPFFTTKGVGQGTGLGLASVHGMAQQLHGWVEVESEPGAGTCFSIYLPSCSAPEPALQSSNRTATILPTRIPRGVLLVEDELLVREAVLKMLKHLNIRVFPALHAADALDVWAKHQSEIDLVLTDLVMPGEHDGLALARHLRALQPNLAIIIMSGYSSDQTKLTSLGKERFEFLGKPFDMPALRKQFSDALTA